jgi:hypothetical protein
MRDPSRFFAFLEVASAPNSGERLRYKGLGRRVQNECEIFIRTGFFINLIRWNYYSRTRRERPLRRGGDVGDPKLKVLTPLATALAGKPSPSKLPLLDFVLRRWGRRGHAHGSQIVPVLLHLVAHICWSGDGSGVAGASRLLRSAPLCKGHVPVPATAVPAVSEG